MLNVNYVPGKLKLKTKSKKKKSAAAKKEKEEEKKLLVRQYNHPDRIELKPITPTNNKYDPDAIVDQLTDAEIQALNVRNKFTKRTLDQTHSISYQEQKEQFNEKLKSYAMHNDLEGD
ncbi:hypothetical protein TRFO_10476 [Tritrichomonas foetus]|uniref:Uncharacterized protein n=1 Tax=Tritrichomonas foetus TaxID=1144522 RepID=A0A1J4JE87_9EUKA|nr:hypothetical protein TRFO_10476 [Tritrichomonas foetus]|eukprot:OHS95572.1 hypothetical protein TRFO_10476 [Tritrichomonas foetus]